MEFQIKTRNRGFLKIFLSIITFTRELCVFILLWVIVWYPFISIWRTPFINNEFSAFLVCFSLSLLMPDFPFIVGEGFAGYRILGSQQPFFQYLNISPNVFCPTRLLLRNLAVSLGISFCDFSAFLFQGLFLSFVSLSMCLMVGGFDFILLGVCLAPWICILTSFLKFEEHSDATQIHV